MTSISWRLLLSPLLLALPLSSALARDSADPHLLELYKDLHAHPELSLQEKKTSARLAQELRALGATRVVESLGGYGVVAVVENGKGPVLMLRADSDALPIREETGKPYASQVSQTDAEGRQVPVMHACGHDMHMTILVGTLQRLMAQKKSWQGTLLLLVQPAEEKGLGALNVLKDGLFEKFPRPQFNLALHVAADLPAGTVGYTSGYAFANVDTVDIKVRGVGAHGAAPHQSKDPIVLAAELVMALQTIVSREISPRESAVLTVGSIHGGTQHNVIPDEVTLQLTVRSYGEAVRTQILQALERMTQGLAAAGGYPKPEIKVLESYTPSVYNDPALSERAAQVFTQTFGADRVRAVPPALVGEDFARYGLVVPKIPGLMFWLGSVEPSLYEKAQKTSGTLPTLHSALYSPDVEATLASGIAALTSLTLDLLPAKL